ncbi:MAG: prolyl oligopeptidase family serine peptidase [Longimicrobiales bacterium]
MMSIQRSRPELRRRAPVSLFPALLLFSLLLPAAAFSQEEAGPGELKTLTLEEYGRWSRITEVALSPDGRWMTYAFSPNEGDADFFWRDLNRLDTAPVDTVTNGSGPAFSPDSRWLAFLTTPPEKEAERLRDQRKPVPRALHLVELGGEEPVEMENVASFTFSGDSRWLAVQKPRPSANGGGAREGGNSRNGGEDAPRGADLILRDLTTGTARNLGNVAEFAFSDDGTHLAYLVDAEERAGNGVYLMALESGVVQPLNTGLHLYEGLTWKEEAGDLAVLRGTKPEGMEQRENVLLAFPGVVASMGSGTPDPTVFDPSEAPGFPEGFVVSEFFTPRWSEDGARIFVGIKEQQETLEESEEPGANVNVWHWKDEVEQSVQRVRAGRERRATDLAAVNLDGLRFVRLADDDMARVQLTDDGGWAVGFDDSAYRLDADHPDNRADVFRIDPSTGQRHAITEALINPMGTSPDSRWFLFWQDRKIQAFDLDSGETVDLTARTGGIDFQDREFDRPVEKPAYGVGGWSNDGEWVFLNHKYDIWKVALNSAESRNLTAGKGDAEEIRFRILDLDTEDDGIDTSTPLLLSVYGEKTKKTGYFRAREGREPEALLWEDALLGSGGFRSAGVRKAEDADRVIFTRQTFADFPDWWVSDARFRDPERITEANPQQSEYAWGSRVLVDFADDRGNQLQATLTLPAGYEEGKRYPMVMYFYEKMSQRHHEYSMPVYDDRPHMSTYASDGYLVLMPDIVYDEGYPGSSALDDVTAAARAVIDAGYADPDRICIQGHSWGGYETSFILTQTDMFACVVTGAPLTNLVSMYNINYKSSGSPNGPILEWSQGRMNTSPYHDFDLYVSQSPIHHVEKITTPFLILHGTADGAVDWNQGLELYNAARRMEKKVILLSYPDEPHHLEREENQKDFQIRMKQFFDHYLKEAPMPRWMAEGVDYLDKDRVGPGTFPEPSRTPPSTR